MSTGVHEHELSAGTGAVSVPRSFDDAVGRLLDICVAGILLIPAAVLVAPVYLAYLLTERKTGPFLFGGSRMGKDKRLFSMYKIRTLVPNAETSIGNGFHIGDRSLEVWYGRFLRRSKLDELPQLINIVRGDMSFVGPRPVRPADYIASYSQISGSDVRFRVQPGITGFSQLYTPGSVPRRARVRIDNAYVRHGAGTWSKCALVGATVAYFVCSTVKESLASIGDVFHVLVAGIAGRKANRFRRSKVHVACRLETGSGGEDAAFDGQIMKVDHEHMFVRVTGGELPRGKPIRITAAYSRRKKGRLRSFRIRCSGTIDDSLTVSQSGKIVALRYGPASEYSGYLIDRYLLGECLVVWA